MITLTSIVPSAFGKNLTEFSYLWIVAGILMAIICFVCLLNKNRKKISVTIPIILIVCGIITCGVTSMIGNKVKEQETTNSERSVKYYKYTPKYNHILPKADNNEMS